VELMSDDAEGATISISRSPAAARMRRHRERRRQGLRCLIIELRETEIDVLVGKGLLSSETRHDSHVVRQALYAYLDQTLCSTPWRVTACSVDAK
jgi:hypothetical protein